VIMTAPETPRSRQNLNAQRVPCMRQTADTCVIVANHPCLTKSFLPTCGYK
jgi:hypothetical protein